MIVNKEKKTSSANTSHKQGHGYQDEALMFQFVLHEFLFASHLLRSPVSPPLLQKLMGDFYQFQTPYLLSPRHSGSLLKLFHYLVMLSIRFPKKNSIDDLLFKDIFQSAEKAINAGIQCQRFFGNNRIEFEKSFAILQGKMKKLSKLLPKRICSYRRNENMLYFLLRRKKDFDVIYHPKMIEELFQELFPGGLKEAVEWIHAQYKQRKFYHLLPLIQQQITSYS